MSQQNLILKGHPLLIEPYGGSAIVSVDASGGTVYFADNWQVSSTSNQGSIAPGATSTFTANTWITSAGVTTPVVVATTSIYDEWASVNPTTIGVGSATVDATGASSGSMLVYSASTSKFEPRNQPIFNVIDYGADPTGVTNSITAFINATTAASAAGGGVVYAPAGTYSFNTATHPGIPFPDGNPSLITYRGDGRGATTIRLSANTPSFVTNSTTGATAKFQNVCVEDMTLDANNTGATTTGGMIFSTFGKMNIDRVCARRVNTINVPISNSVAGRRGVDLTISTGGPTDPDALTMTNVLIEDCDFQGGNTGVLLEGFSATLGPPSTIGTGNWPNVFQCNIFGDNLIIRRCSHDRGSAPTTTAPSSNFMVGQFMTCGRVLIEDCIGNNASDDGIEVDSVAQCIVRRCQVTNSQNEGYFFSNLNGCPCPPDQQYIVFDDCTYDGTVGGSNGAFWMHSRYIPAGNVIMSRCKAPTYKYWFNGGFTSITLNDCTYQRKPGTLTTGAGSLTYLPGLQFTLLQGRGVVNIRHFNASYVQTADGSGNTGTVQLAVPVSILQVSDYIFNIDGVRVRHNVPLINSAGTALRVINLFQSGTGNNETYPLTGTVTAFSGNDFFIDAGHASDLNVGSSKLASAGTNLTTEGRYRWLSNTADYTWGLIGPQTDAEMLVAGQPDATTLAGFKMGAIVKGIDASNYIEGYLADDGTTTTLNLDIVVAGVRTALIAPVATTRVANGTTAQVDLVQVGDTATVTHTIAGVTQQTLSATLSSTQINTHGRGVQGNVGFSFVPAGAGAFLNLIKIIRRMVLGGTIAKLNVAEAVGLGNGVSGNCKAYGLNIEQNASALWRVNGDKIRARDWNMARLDGNPGLLGNIAWLKTSAAADGGLFVGRDIVHPPSVAPNIATVTAPGSATAHINQTGLPYEYHTTAGTLTTPFVEKSIDSGVTWTQVAYSATAMGPIRLDPNDQIRWTYSVAPTIKRIPLSS